MIPWLLAPILLATGTGPLRAPGQLDPAIRPVDIQTHVDYLASDELEGRHAESDKARIAARYVAKHFREFGLRPLGKGEDLEAYFLPIDDEKVAPNVVGVLPGSGPGYVLVGAHYDHLAPRKNGDDRIFNGADDNASGVAAVLEIAHASSARSEAAGATLVFVAFTAEERGLRGSRHFVAHPPIPLDEIIGVVNLDMISRGKPNLIFCEGGENELMRRAADKANLDVGLEVRFDEHPRWRFLSDHAPFMQKGIPTLYFGVEDHEDYHKVTDHADKILPELASRVAELTYRILLDLGARPLSGASVPEREK